MNGWTGKILHVDLSERAVRVLEPGPETYHRAVGGKGLAGHFLTEHVTKPWDDPGMPLLFFAGPLVGTAAPASGRMAVMSRSPLTGAVGDASVGGSFGTQLKRAGWDGIIVDGASEEPCGIEITDGRAEIRGARGTRGFPVSKMNEYLKGKGAAAVTGPAAESGVRFANIMFDGHYAAGRSGLGLVCAAKNLKYVTVRGTGTVAVHDPDALDTAREDIFRLAAASPALMGAMGITNYGTAAIYDLTGSRRMMPTDNFRKTFFEDMRVANAHAYAERYAPKKTGCWGCHVLCKKIGRGGEILPEFETMNHFSALLENGDIDIVVEANRICNEAGMDTISAGATLSCYAEIAGRKLRGGEILSLLEDIAAGRGIGARLALGSREYALAEGRPRASMTVKGLELPAYDPRGAYGMALGYAVSTRGGCHLRAYPIGNEILRKPVPTDRFTFSGKSRIVKIAEDANAVVDSLTACKFLFFGASLEEYAKAYTAVTGVETSGQELLRLGERIYYAERIMNAMNGFSAADDDLPDRFFSEAGSSGNNIEIRPIDRADFLRARANYYRVRGLDGDGMPTRGKSAELGLPWNG